MFSAISRNFAQRRRPTQSKITLSSGDFTFFTIVFRTKKTTDIRISYKSHIFYFLHAFIANYVKVKDDLINYDRKHSDFI